MKIFVIARSGPSVSVLILQRNLLQSFCECLALSLCRVLVVVLFIVLHIIDVGSACFIFSEAHELPPAILVVNCRDFLRNEFAWPISKLGELDQYKVTNYEIFG